MLKVDPFEVYSVVTGSIRLDGGAMFGVVPKVLWEKVADVDNLNRILLATRTLLAVDRGHWRVVLVDTGCGTKWAPDLAERYEARFDPDAIPSSLKAIGLSTDDVTDVVITHLHFDHAGGMTYWFDERDGPTRLHYPQARHWVHRAHWEHANNPHHKDRASFFVEDFAELTGREDLQFVEGDGFRPAFDGVEWFVSSGHTPGQLHPVFGSGRERLVWAGDLCPTMAHLRLAWVMAYDMEPLGTIREKETLLRRCIHEGWLLAFPHDPNIAGVALDGPVERPVVTRALSF
jgi:glyoxylase-like metal-dependent hydrolase (beta-lactamase superfamily II)